MEELLPVFELLRRGLPRLAVSVGPNLVAVNDFDERPIRPTGCIFCSVWELNKGIHRKGGHLVVLGLRLLLPDLELGEFFPAAVGLDCLFDYGLGRVIGDARLEWGGLDFDFQLSGGKLAQSGVELDTPCRRIAKHPLILKADLTSSQRWPEFVPEA